MYKNKKKSKLYLNNSLNSTMLLKIMFTIYHSIHRTLEFQVLNLISLFFP